MEKLIIIIIILSISVLEFGTYYRVIEIVKILLSLVKKNNNIK